MSDLESSRRQLNLFWTVLGLPESRWLEASDAFGCCWRAITEHNDRAALIAARTTEADFHLKHIADSLAILQVRPEWLTHPVELADVGSGAGLPGLVLAIALPELRLTAIESTGRKAEFIGLLAEELGLTDRVEVIARRSRELGHDPSFAGRFDVVVARAVASADKLIGDCRLLRASTGSMIFYKTPAAVIDELPLARREAAKHGLTVAVSKTISLPAGAGQRQFMIVSTGA